MSEAEATPRPWRGIEYIGEHGATNIGVETDYPEALCNGARLIAYMTGSYDTRLSQPEPERAKAIRTNLANRNLMLRAVNSHDALVQALHAFCNAFSANGDFNYLSAKQTIPELLVMARAAIAKVTGED